MIALEIPNLKEELGGRVLSLRAKRHISGQLKKRSAKSVNIEIDERTARQLRTLIEQGNLVRDAFFCRLLVFLRGSDHLLKELGITRQTGSLGSGLEQMPISPLKAMEAVRDDPLYYIRAHVREEWDCGIYTVPLPKELNWMACFIEEKNIPGTKAHKEEKALEAAIFGNVATQPIAAPLSKQRRSKK